ncbi:MAG TPA: hypothetical protein VLG37_01020 [Candidatus Saccharimonadales bacterium]|nr:hypothetical protein [Candidatus Saccharimonadales bacterium]
MAEKLESLALPEPYHEDMMKAVEDARRAVRGTADSRFSNAGHFGLEGMGNQLGPHVSESISINPHSDNPEATEAHNIVAINEKRLTDKYPSPYSNYDARIEWRGGNPSDVVKNSVKVSRVDSRGERYNHTFKNPDTARKFADLIARQVTRRAEAAKAEQRRAA